MRKPTRLDYYMNINNTPIHAKSLFESAKSYMTANLKLFNISISVKIIRFISTVMTGFALFLVFTLFILFISGALAFWLGELLGAVYYGFLIVSGIFLLFGITIYIFRRTIILNPLIRKSAIIFFMDDDFSQHNDSDRESQLKNIKDVNNEKARLKEELNTLEEEIKDQYDEIIEAFSFQNIQNSITEQVPPQQGMVSQVVSWACRFFSCRR